MSKFNKKRIKPQLNTNYKLFGWLGSWIEEIENRIDNISGDIVIDTIENSIKNIWSKIYNLENKHDSEMRIESQVRKENDDFLQNQINQEIQDRIAGDNAINKRIDDIQFLKWLVSLEFGSAVGQEMYLQSESWTKYFELPLNYGYSRSYILASKLIINVIELYNGEIQLLDYGIRTNLVAHDSKSCLEISYNPAQNIKGQRQENIVIQILLTQFYYGDVE